jgi:predicted HTH transcriptional regulator
MANTESNRIEFKREIDEGDKLEKAVVSFLNYNGGGEIFIGIADDGTVVGIADSDGDQRKIADRLGNNIRPKILGLFDVIAEKQEGKDVIRIVVSSGTQKPYYIRKKGMTEDGCFVRVGASAQPMTEAMIERLLQHRQANTLSTTVSSRQKLSFEQLHIYYNEHGHKLNEQFENNLDLRNSNDEYNFLAYLLADNNGASIKVAKYAGTDKVDLIENEEYGYRCLITAVYRVLGKLEVENKTFSKITPRNRLERKLIKPLALRESFINAVVHNDYNLGWPLVEFFSDRVVITSTGGLVEGMTEEDLLVGRSMLRNRELMRVFKDVELVEGLGSGVRRILEDYDRSVFDITSGFIVVTLPYASGFKQSNSETLDNNERSVSEVVSEVMSGVMSEVMSEDEIEKVGPILAHLEKHGMITPKDARSITGKSAATTRRYLNLLCEKGILETTGNTNAVTYRLNRPR